MCGLTLLFKFSLIQILVYYSFAVHIQYDCSRLQFWNRETRTLICNDTSRSIYHCAWNLFENKYTELCWPIRILILEGRRPTIQLGLHNGSCPIERYQPAPVVSNFTIDCWYVKSKCSEEGQVVCNKTIPYQDISCRCDYSKGYSFVNVPENKLYCIPSKEDCSCYRKNCENHKYLLNPEYECVSRENITHYSNVQHCLLINETIGTGDSVKNLPPVKALIIQSVSEPLDFSLDAAKSILAFILFLTFIVPVLTILCPFCLCKSKRCTYTVKEGADAIFEIYIYGTSFIRDVKWRKIEPDTELNDKAKYSTSLRNFYWYHICVLTIKNADVKDEGRYECFVSNYGRRFSYITLKKLTVNRRPGARIITHTVEQIEQHIKDATYHKLIAVDNGIEILKSSNTLLLLGNEGCGKTKMCLEIAKQYKDNGYVVFMFSGKDFTNPVEYISPKRKELHIYDVNIHSEKFEEKGLELVNIFKTYSSNLDVRFIISVLTSYHDTVLDKEKYDGNNQIALNPLSKEEKMAILEKQMVKNNIQLCNNYYETNYDDPEVISDTTKVVNMYCKTVDAIIDVNTLMGFPKACSMFCSNRFHLQLETRYFSNPPKSVVEDINTYRSGKDKQCSPEYVVMVYILMNGKLNVTILKENMDEIYSIFKKLNMSNLMYFAIKDAADRLLKKFLKRDGDVYSFYHVAFSKAIWLSYMDVDSDYCMAMCPWNYIDDLIRPFSCPTDENEVCIRVKNNVLLRRLKSELSKSALSVGQYLRKMSTCAKDLIVEFCEMYMNEDWDIDISLNLCSGMTDVGTTYELFLKCPKAVDLLIWSKIDKYGNCLVNYCVVQDYARFLSEMSDSAADMFMNIFNTSGYSPCHVMFYLGRKINEKHLAVIPRSYDYYSKLNKLVRIGQKKHDKIVESKHLRVVGKMDIHLANVIKQCKFGSNTDFDSVKDALKTLKKETMIMVRLEEVPPQVNDNDIKTVLQSLNCTIIKYYHEKRRQKGRLTNVETGDHVAICKPLSNPLPTSIHLGLYEIKVSNIERNFQNQENGTVRSQATK